VQVSDSPSGTFRLETCRYSTGPKTWNYSRGIVKRIADDTIIVDVKRNFGPFWHTWVGHADGNEYLLCGEDYQGYSIVNLTAGTCKTFFPEEGGGGRRRDRHGVQFVGLESVEMRPPTTWAPEKKINDPRQS
jgi:hypothetical protein